MPIQVRSPKLTVGFSQSSYILMTYHVVGAEHKLEFLLGQLSGHREWDWYHFMLNSSNHRPGIPVDWLSYHFCENQLRTKLTRMISCTPDATRRTQRTKPLFSFQRLSLAVAAVNRLECIEP